MTCTRTINARGSSHSDYYYRLFSPNCPLVAVQCASRQGHIPTLRVEHALPHAHTQPTCPRLACTLSRTPATTTTRCNSVRAHPWLSGKTLHRGGDPLLLFFLHGSHLPTSVSGNTLSSAPRQTIRFPSLVAYSKNKRNREDFRLAIEDRGSIA